ncbi:MAG: CPBP family intramembrane metalloprotease [Chloroflexi bacterium]|nr:CPBP family intramembrane metalloprotease [Chloroflexota bacterium]
MSQLTSLAPPTSVAGLGIANWIRRHSLIAYFVLAYVLTWTTTLPLVLSQRGLRMVNLPEGLLLALLLLATYIGPLPSALIVTYIVEGKAGVKQLLRRMVQWRVGIGWYLLILIGYPLVFLLGASAYMGITPLTALLQKWPLLLTSYLPAALIGILYPSLGEEPGWRGFALPRLQQQHGPLIGSLILGALHGFWHLPAYFLPGFILPGRFDPVAFAANTCAIIVMTVIWTWLFNHGQASVFLIMLVHGVSNANSGLFPQLIPTGGPEDQWFSFKVMGVVALLLIIFTRGKLGYQPPVEDSSASWTG